MYFSVWLLVCCSGIIIDTKFNSIKQGSTEDIVHEFTLLVDKMFELDKMVQDGSLIALSFILDNNGIPVSGYVVNGHFIKMGNIE